MLGALITALGCVDTGQKVLAGTEQRRRNCNVNLVDERGAKILADGSHATAEPDVSTLCGFAGAR